MIKKFFSALALVLFATSMMAQSGLTCEDAIPVDKNYRATIDGPCEIWYTASTYDLPIHVYFSPVVDDSDWGPEVQVDLTCTPGVYEDHKIDSLINLVSDFDVSFPLEFLSELVVRNGKNEWDLSVSKTYRDNMAEFGVTYPVQAFVKVTYYEAGTVSLTPDTAFTSCIDNADRVYLADTFDITANDADRVFVFPYSDWQEDSIRFVWTGEQPAEVYVAVQECNFTPSATNPYVFDNFTIAQDAPHKMYSDELKAAIKEQKEGGVYFAKVIASGAGQLVVEKIPLSAIEGDAQLLEHGTEIVLEDALYCFPKTWTATQIVAATSQPVTMYISNVAEFVQGDQSVLKTCVASLEGSQRMLYLSGKELANLADQAIGDYLYVRFSCAASTKVSINAWDASDCANKSMLLNPNTPQLIAPRSSLTAIYRVRYSDFSGYPMTIKWSSSDRMMIYIAETCDFSLTTNNAALLLNPAPSIAKGSELFLEATEVDSWASRIADDGYFYIRIDSKRAGEVTLATDKKEGTVVTPDPINTTITETLCYGESYEWNGQTYSTTGEYTQNFTAANGADSIVTLKLTILPEVAPTTEEATIEAGETYTWNGKEYSEAGEYTITLQDKNGCDYQATLVLKVNEPLSPCLQSSIKLNVGDEVVINLDSAFTVYAIDYAAWMAQPVTLVWTGAEALHTFVAETCVFALAPYNRYVHAYVPVPAQGDSALDMEALAPYVDADGYLYVRFLTEFEGTLKVGR